MIASFVVATGQVVWNLGQTRTSEDFATPLATVVQQLPNMQRYDWVVDLDIRGFFDNIDHALMMQAVRKHTDCPWVLLYIERWLKAPVELEDGTQLARDRGVQDRLTIFASKPLHELPHMMNSGVPFMKSATGSFSITFLMLSAISLMSSLSS